MNRKIIVLVVVLAIIGISGYALMVNNATTSNQETATTVPTTAVSPSPMEATDAPAATESGAMAETKEFTVESKGLNFTPNTITVKMGDTVKITYKNTLGKHDFVIDEFNVATQLLSAGQEETVEFVADKKGSFEFYCSVAGHRAQGMKGTLVVE